MIAVCPQNAAALEELRAERKITFPIVVDHPNYRVGKSLEFLHDELVEDGAAQQPILATGAIGLLGYYSRMPIIDRLGLTDADPLLVAPVAALDRPDKWAEPVALEPA